MNLVWAPTAETRSLIWLSSVKQADPAELNRIYLLQRVQRQGLGRLLLCAVARQFNEQGVSSMLLFGDATSPSNGFYEAFGAERLYSDRGEFHGGCGWSD